jgi:GTPase SAR1 family protein
MVHHFFSSLSKQDYGQLNSFENSFLCDHRENVLRVKCDDPQLPIILIGNKSDLAASRRVTHDEALSVAQSWHVPYVETSAKTRDHVDKAFSQIFIAIKELKAERQRTAAAASGGGGGRKATGAGVALFYVF